MLGYVFSNERLISYVVSDSTVELTKELLETISIMPEWFTAISLFATVGMILAVLFYCTKIERRPVSTLGFVKKGAFKEYIIGLGVGFAMFSLSYGIILLSGQAEFKGFNSSVSVPLILLFFVGFIIQGANEEILFRGYYLVSGYCCKKNMVLAIFLSSVFFALYHIFNNVLTIMAIINLILSGVLAALYFLRRGSIWGVAALHSIWNFAQGNIFGCSVSGSINFSTTIFNIVQLEGSTLFNGGEFGPEGGLGVTIVFVVGIVILLFMKNKEVEI